MPRDLRLGLRHLDVGRDAVTPWNPPVAGRRPPIDALLVWLTPDRQLQPELNRFEIRVSEAGDTWIERLPW